MHATLHHTTPHHITSHHITHTGSPATRCRPLGVCQVTYQYMSKATWWRHAIVLPLRAMSAIKPMLARARYGTPQELKTMLIAFIVREEEGWKSATPYLLSFSRNTAVKSLALP